MTAPGPWTRLQHTAVEAATEMLSRQEDIRGRLIDAVNDLPDPREADLAGEALDALKAAFNLINDVVDYLPADVINPVYTAAESILRRAGRLS